MELVAAPRVRQQLHGLAGLHPVPGRAHRLGRADEPPVRLRPDAHPDPGGQLRAAAQLADRRRASAWSAATRARRWSARSTTPAPTATIRSTARVNSDRDGAFHQLDLRIDKRWVYQSWMLNVYLDIQNVYNRANPEGAAVQLQLPAVEAAAGAAAADHPGHPGRVLRPAMRNTRAIISQRVIRLVLTAVGSGGGDPGGSGGAGARPAAARAPPGLLPEHRALQRRQPHLGGRRVAGDLAQRRLHLAAGSDVDAVGWGWDCRSTPAPAWTARRTAASSGWVSRARWR